MVYSDYCVCGNKAGLVIIHLLQFLCNTICISCPNLKCESELDIDQTFMFLEQFNQVTSQWTIHCICRDKITSWHFGSWHFGKLIFWELTFWELTFLELTFWKEPHTKTAILNDLLLTQFRKGSKVSLSTSLPTQVIPPCKQVGGEAYHGQNPWREARSVLYNHDSLGCSKFFRTLQCNWYSWVSRMTLPHAHVWNFHCPPAIMNYLLKSKNL